MSLGLGDNASDAGRASATRAVEMAARAGYGRLLAYLVSRTGDVAGAEDALGEAFLQAMQTWPRAGIPERPEAWLLTTARRRQIDALRHGAATTAVTQALLADAERALREDFPIEAGASFPDERLKLLFLCTHPAIDPGVRTPLMLQAVLGIDAATIAAAFLVAPAAMGQRLARAKSKIKRAAIRLEAPGASELSGRVEAVLDAIYTVYGLGWDRGVAGADTRWQGLTEEAVWLARLTVDLLPGDPEAKGLLALMLYCESRRATRRSRGGAYVPLSEQDATLWSRSLIESAESLLDEAARAGCIGRYQLEAAIQSAHSRRAYSGAVNWQAVAALYDGLARIAPTAGALVGRAAALAEIRPPEEALQTLDAGALPDMAASYQPYWALKAHLLRKIGRSVEALAAYRHALGLTENAATREYLARQVAELGNNTV